MSYDYYEAHATEYEVIMAYYAEEEAFTQMEADYETSGGHLWR